MTQFQPLGFLAIPPTGTGPGVLVLHAWWGLNDTIRSICTRLADNGLVAFAADLYHGKVANTIPEAEILGGALDTTHVQAEAEVAEAAKFLYDRVGQPERGIAVLALSLGGYYALHLSATQPETIHSVVLFYGTEGTMGTDFSLSKADYLGHFAENDPYETQSNVSILEKSLRRAGRLVTFYTYRGTTHWFFEPDRPDAYDQSAASLAWGRTLAFLKRPTPAKS